MHQQDIRFPIKNKILVLALAASLPFLVMVIYLLISMANYSRNYDQIVSSMTVANNYNLNFKEEMDESLYKLVDGNHYRGNAVFVPGDSECGYGSKKEELTIISNKVYRLPVLRKAGSFWYNTRSADSNAGRKNQMKKYIMALDQGTTSSRCILFDKSGNICSMSQKEFTQIYPKPGWVEHNPKEIWSSQLAVATECMAISGAEPSQIAAIGITNQRETTILWNKHTGEPVYNAIVWQCRRTSDMIEELKEDGFDKVIRKKTGLIPDAYFSASKIAWILQNVPGAEKMAKDGDLLFGTVDTWLIWNLTKGAVHVTDYTNASRTMLFDIHRLCWDEEILERFGIPASILPKVKPSGCIFGLTDSSVLGLGGSIPIAGAAGDQQAALFGQCCFEQGDVKNTYGTGCFMLMNTGKNAIQSKSGLLTTIVAGTSDEVEYALEGSVFVAGAGVQWLRDSMRMIRNAAQSQEYCGAVEDTAGMYIVPAFAGMGAPYWNQYARGTVVGLTRGCTKEHFIRATLESIAYQTADVLRAMEQDSGMDLNSLKVDGGACANDFLMQFQADIVDTTVQRPLCIETTALGAAYLAGLAVGYWKDKEEIRANWKIGHTFEPHMEQEKRNALLKGWKRAVRCAITWAEDQE